MKLQAKVKYIESIMTEDFNTYQKVIDFLGDSVISYNIIYKKNKLVDVDIAFNRNEYGTSHIDWSKGNVIIKESNGKLSHSSIEYLKLNYDIIEE